MKGLSKTTDSTHHHYDFMKANPDELWEKFRIAFRNALEDTSKEELLEMWQTVRAKTSFYELRLMPAIEKWLGYHLVIEKQRCDYTFVDDNGVPLIAVESENAHTTASHEVHSLCCLSAPLKILLISCDWKATEKDKYLPRWAEIIRKHHEIVSMECLYAIFVGEWDEPVDARLTYSFALINSTGTVKCEDEDIVDGQAN